MTLDQLFEVFKGKVYAAPTKVPVIVSEVQRDNLTTFAVVYYERVLATAISDELVTLVRETAREIIKKSPELQEEIRFKALEFINEKFNLNQ